MVDQVEQLTFVPRLQLRHRLISLNDHVLALEVQHTHTIVDVTNQIVSLNGQPDQFDTVLDIIIQLDFEQKLNAYNS